MAVIFLAVAPVVRRSSLGWEACENRFVFLIDNPLGNCASDEQSLAVASSSVMSLFIGTSA